MTPISRLLDPNFQQLEFKIFPANFPISSKFPNFQQISQFSANFPIFSKFPNFQQMTPISSKWPQFPANDPNFQQMTPISSKWPQFPANDPISSKWPNFQQFPVNNPNFQVVRPQQCPQHHPTEGALQLPPHLPASAQHNRRLLSSLRQAGHPKVRLLRHWWPLQPSLPGRQPQILLNIANPTQYCQILLNIAKSYLILPNPT